MGGDVPRGGLRDRTRRRRPDRSAEAGAVELRAVRGDHRQGRPADASRGRQRPRVLEHVAVDLATAATNATPVPGAGVAPTACNRAATRLTRKRNGNRHRILLDPAPPVGSLELASSVTNATP